MSLLIAALFCALAIVGSAKQSKWAVVAIFSAVEVMSVYLLLTVPLRPSRGQRIRSFLAERDQATETHSDPKPPESGLQLLRAFRAQEPANLRRRLQIRLAFAAFAAFAVAVYVAVVVALTQ